MNDPKILIVEDDDSIRETLQSLLDFVGLPARWATHAQEAIDTITHLLAEKLTLPSVIVVDGRLPDMHGLELIRILRQKLPNETAIYLFSADSHMAGPSLNPNSGLRIDGFIAKPFDADEFVGILTQHVADSHIA